MESHKCDIVLSCKGRDLGEMLLVVDEDEKRLYVANGRGRRAERPKSKSRRHVIHQGTCDERTREKLLKAGRLTNNDIRRALALWTGDQAQIDPREVK